MSRKAVLPFICCQMEVRKTENKKAASNAKRDPLCENRRFPLSRKPTVSCLLRLRPNPRRTQNCVPGRRINPAATRFFKSLDDGLLIAAPSFVLSLFSLHHHTHDQQNTGPFEALELLSRSFFVRHLVFASLRPTHQNPPEVF